MVRRTAPTVVLLFVIAAWTVASDPGPAQADDRDKDVVSNMSAARIERIMQSFRDVKSFKEVDDGAYSFEIDSTRVLIINKGDTLQLVSMHSKKKVTLSRLNEWNRTRRFTRAFVDKDGDVFLAADLELTGGVTEKNVKEWFLTYRVSLKGFIKHLEE